MQAQPVRLVPQHPWLQQQPVTYLEEQRGEILLQAQKELARRCQQQATFYWEDAGLAQLLAALCAESFLI